MKAQPINRIEMELQAPAVRKAIVRSRLEQLSDIQREKYVIDNVEQSEQLAEELQYLVGRTYFDDDTGHQYEVESVLYDEPIAGLWMEGPTSWTIRRSWCMVTVVSYSCVTCEASTTDRMASGGLHQRWSGLVLSERT